MGKHEDKHEDAEIEHDIKKAEKIDKSFKKCKKWIQKIEKKYDTKVICICGEFTDNLYEMFVRQLTKVEKERRKGDWITIVMHSLGGDADVAFKIMDIMRKHKCRFSVVVPINASSAGAEVAMNADKLIIGKYTYLTAFDTHVGGIALKNVFDAKLERCTSLKDYHKLKEARNYKSVSRNELDKMFQHRYSKEVIDNLQTLFVNHNTSHEYPISYEEIISTGVTHVEQRKINKWFYKIVYHYTDGEFGSGFDSGFRYEFYQERLT